MVDKLGVTKYRRVDPRPIPWVFTPLAAAKERRASSKVSSRRAAESPPVGRAGCDDHALPSYWPGSVADSALAAQADLRSKLIPAALLASWNAPLLVCMLIRSGRGKLVLADCKSGRNRSGKGTMEWRVGVVLLLLISAPWGFAAGEEAEGKEEGEPAKPSSVLELDASSFEDAVAKHDFIVVEFYAPWCGHCKNLAPEYEKAAEILKENDPPIILAKVDGNEDSNKALLEEHDVRGFPTLKIFRSKGLVGEEYKGPRDAEGIVEYLKKQAGPVSQELKSAEQAKEFVASAPVVIVGLFEEFEGEDYSRFIIAAESVRSDFVFAHTKDASHLPGDVKAPAVGLFKAFDEGFVSSKDFSLQALTAFFEEESLPLVTEMNKDPASHPFLLRFFNHPDPKVFFLVDYSASNIDEHKKVYSEQAKATKGKGLKFLIANLEEADNALKFFGLEREVAPVLIIHDNEDHKFIKQNAEPSEVASWISDYFEGKLVPHVKSEPVPETNDEPVKVVVGKTLKSFLDSGKFVLLEFYAPWCGHCKKLAPTLDEVAESFKDKSDVVIAKFDATANDVPKDVFQVDGFPTLYLHTPTGDVVLYTGDRSKEDLIEFIEKHRNPDFVSHLESVTESTTEESNTGESAEDVKDEL